MVSDIPYISACVQHFQLLSAGSGTPDQEPHLWAISPLQLGLKAALIIKAVINEKRELELERVVQLQGGGVWKQHHHSSVKLSKKLGLTNHQKDKVGSGSRVACLPNPWALLSFHSLNPSSWIWSCSSFVLGVIWITNQVARPFARASNRFSLCATGLRRWGLDEVRASTTPRLSMATDCCIYLAGVWRNRYDLPCKG